MNQEPVFTLSPFWLGYAVALAVCVGWAWRLSRDAEQRDAETDKRDRDARDLAVRREWARWMKEQIADVQSKRERSHD